MSRRVHTFENGVVVYDDHLLASQRHRYARRNVHEAEEEDLFVEIIRTLPPTGCFVNIGGAIGYYALLAKRLSSNLQIHVVEPLQRHREFFEDNVRLNGFSSVEFEIHPEAVAAADGAVNFIEADYSSVIQPRSGRSLRDVISKFLFASRPANGSKSHQVTVVNAVTLDSLVAKIERPVDLLQMDVQGSEVDVLRGGSRTLRSAQVKRFLIGTHGEKIHFECIEQLRRYNYRIECDRARGHEQPDGILFATAHFC